MAYYINISKFRCQLWQNKDHCYNGPAFYTLLVTLIWFRMRVRAGSGRDIRTQLKRYKQQSEKRSLLFYLSPCHCHSSFATIIHQSGSSRFYLFWFLFPKSGRLLERAMRRYAIQMGRFPVDILILPSNPLQSCYKASGLKMSPPLCFGEELYLIQGL